MVAQAGVNGKVLLSLCLNLNIKQLFMEALKKYGLDVAAIVLFVLISFAYFVPASLEGRILFQHDASAGKGLGHEQTEYYQ